LSQVSSGQVGTLDALADFLLDAGELTGDRPIARLVYWSIRTTLCPEPYIELKVESGQETKWTYTYQFYRLGGK
jgi:hypothetical protein